MNRKKLLLIIFLGIISFSATLFTIANLNNCVILPHRTQEDDSCKIFLENKMNDLPYKLTPVDFLELSDDQLSQLLLSVLDDTIVETNSKYEYRGFNSNSIPTEKGYFGIYRDSFDSVSVVQYFVYEDGIIPENLRMEFVNNFMSKIGYEQDGFEDIQSWNDSQNYNIYVYQRTSDLTSYGGGVKFHFYDDHLQISIGPWHQDLESLEIISKDKARKIAFNYVVSFPVILNYNLIQCGFQPSYSPEYASNLNLVGDHLVYVLTAGGCSIGGADDQHRPWFNVVIDAVTGEPLYLKPGIVF